MRTAVLACLLAAVVVVPSSAPAQSRRPSHPRPAVAPAAKPASSSIPFDDARPIVAEFVERQPASLPEPFRGLSVDQVRPAWDAWVARRDAEIRGRLAQGDEDSLVNFLLFGVSFTGQPRATGKDIARFGVGKSVADVVAARLDDLVAGIAAPGANERLRFAQSVVRRGGIDPTTASGKARTRDFLVGTIERVLAEANGITRTLEAAKLLGDPTAEFAERSTLYRARGLSSDTSIQPDFAIDQSLEAMKAQGLLAPGSVRRVAIVGPGLDFTDKGEGYDFYPQQTVQPFAVIDSLMRYGLARSGDLRMTTFDLSPRVNDHVTAAVERARRGESYTIQLVRDPEAGWTSDLVAYWERFGDRVGVPTPPAPAPTGAGELKLRAVKVRPDVVSTIRTADLNVVLQRPATLAPDERFDLIVATNILVYYDTFEQCLALANVAKMLRPGGFLLSNNALYEVETTPVHSVGYQTSIYSNRKDDGDHVVWYRLDAAPSARP